MKEGRGALDVSVSERDDHLAVHIGGALEAADVADAKRVVARLPTLEGRTLEVSLDPQPLKTRGMVVLERICKLVEEAGAEVTVRPADEAMKAALSAHAAPKERPKPPRRPKWRVSRERSQPCVLGESWQRS